jgi:hypothetical protein
MKVMYMLALILLSGWAAFGQEYEQRPWMALENRVGLALGLGSVRYLDKNSSPLIYQSRPKQLRLFYNLETNDFLFAFNVDLKTGGNAPKYHRDRTVFFHEEDYKGKTEDKKFPAGGSFLGARVSLGAFYKIHSTQNSTFKVAVGGSISNEMFYPQGWTSGGIFNALSLNPEAWVQHRVDEHHSFTATVRLPVVTYLSRLPYDNTVSRPGQGMASSFLNNGKWVGPGKYLAPAFTLGYNYQFDTHWGAGLSYDYGWYHTPIPQTLKATSSSVLANFQHQF